MPEKILIVKPSSLGDIIHSLPVLNAIKKFRPHSEVHWVIDRGYEELLRNHPLVDRTIVINKDNWRRPLRGIKTLMELKRLFGRLRAEGYDTVIDLQGLFRSGIITFVTSAPLRIGFEDARELSPLFYSRKVRVGRELHAVRRNLKLLKAIGIETDEVAFPFPETENSGLEKPYYVVVSGARWKTKQWPLEYFAGCINALSGEDGRGLFEGARAVLVGSGTDEGITRRISSMTGGNAINMAGKTGLGELISIIKGASFVIANDSGPMHIAAALNVTVFAVFGPTSEALTGPYGMEGNVLSAPLPCRPCFRRDCKTVQCMKDVSPEELIRRVVDYYKKN
ncbi:lipopolysaccharide heptosyltransferase 1 [bacterium BMS3Bbin06]|nr:lipopolysaccharide heptosyltransferase 1 [bacterium BMS3Abin08]GBE35307.1 lipopolysaccharide heptosyltransferase 1 [bacterium BMS3Bbin06]HDO35740.1 glycosyltransferase family 9 protein [Nitrospirota bacterium]HDY71967.1 glycosyltransferase family 9 protein [Nitrospirota bacterium]